MATKNKFRDPNYGEPKFTKELTKSELMQSLNWYAQNRDKKDALKYATDYFRKKLKTPISAATLKVQSSSFGFLCRIVSNGGILNQKDMERFQADIERIKTEEAKPRVEEEEDDGPPTPNIQDRINEKVGECVGDLEGQFDDYMLSGFTNMGSPYGVMHTHGMKGVHANKLIKIYQKKKAHFEEVLDTTDKQLKEGYSNFKRMQIKKIIGYMNTVIEDATKIKTAAAKNRKPRARKKK